MSNMLTKIRNSFEQFSLPRQRRSYKCLGSGVVQTFSVRPEYDSTALLIPTGRTPFHVPATFTYNLKTIIKRSNRT